MQQVVVFGNGQMASMMGFYLSHDSPFQVAAFTVDGQHIREDTLMGAPVVPFEELDRSHPPAQFALSMPISYRNVNQLRAAKFQEARAKGYRLISYISSKAITWPGLVTGENCIILEGSVIQPFVELGDNVFVGCASVIGHNCAVGDHCFIAPGAIILGYVRVEAYSFIGGNATIRDGITVGAECVIGAGVTISRDTRSKEVYIGERVEPSKKRSDELRQWLTWSR
ncbi:MAG TPA: acetyltransferase [Nitrospiraceae bacterium]|nr:acetyltransferase [Nitrospiraceae bacterium]